MGKSKLSKKERSALAARLRKGQLSNEDREALAQWVEILEWKGDHYEYEDTDGKIAEVWFRVPADDATLTELEQELGDAIEQDMRTKH